MADTIIDSFYKEFTDLLKFLDDSKEISLRSTVDATFKRTLALEAVSYFEQEITTILKKFVDQKSNSNTLLNNFVENKAIARQYHTFFDWEVKNANRFFSLFGNEFKLSAIQDIKADVELDKAIKDFIDLGSNRNELVHLGFANVALNKTAEEVYHQFQQARKFITFIDAKLNELQEEGEPDA